MDSCPENVQQARPKGRRVVDREPRKIIQTEIFTGTFSERTKSRRRVDHAIFGKIPLFG